MTKLKQIKQRICLMFLAIGITLALTHNINHSLVALNVSDMTAQQNIKYPIKTLSVNTMAQFNLCFDSI